MQATSLAGPALLLLTSLPALAQDATSGPSGVLEITAPVQGAAVYIDNQLVGQIPLTTRLSPGAHTVRVQADYFDPFVRRVTVVQDRTTELTAALLPGNGTIEFVVEPSGATLTLNGRDEYPTPVRLRDLSPGTYTYEVEAEGYEPATGQFEFALGKNLLIVEELPSSRGRFAVSSRPEGASVFLDGDLVGTTPVELEGIAPGLHQVLLDMQGYASVIRTVDTSDGSKGVVDARMPDDGASLTVRTNSGDATVRLNGVIVGEGRTVRLPELERGRYTLQVTRPGADPVEARVEVPERGGAWWKARLGDAPQLDEYTPVTRSWIFWAGAGAVAGGAAAGGVIAYNASIPDAVPPGDIVVSMP